MTRVLALIPIVLLAACGGGGASAGGVSKADYIRQAEAICTKANVDQKALATPAGIPDLAPYVAKVVDIADKATASLVALDLPAADKAGLEAKVLQPLQKQVEAGHAYAAAVAKAQNANDQPELVKLLSNPPTKAEADLTWMRGYGFAECVQAADTSS